MPSTSAREKRMLVGGGKLDNAYQIAVPEERDAVR
jgi:hypothetical protein